MSRAERAAAVGRALIFIAFVFSTFFGTSHAAIAEGPAALEASGGWIRLPPPGANAAGYLTLVNAADTPQRIVGVESDVAPRAEIHRSWVEEGVAHMRRVESIEVPARGELELAPKGLHVMLIRPAGLKEGERVELRFDVEGQAPLIISLPVMRTAPGGSHAEN